MSGLEIGKDAENVLLFYKMAHSHGTYQKFNIEIQLAQPLSDFFHL